MVAAQSVQQEESDEQKIRQAAAYGATFDDEARGLAHAVSMLSKGRPWTLSEAMAGRLQGALRQIRDERAQRRQEYLIEVLRQ